MNFILDEEIIELIHFQSNLKSVQEERPAHIAKEEIKVFLGINIIMDYNKLNNMNHYWKIGNDIGVQCIKDRMSRNRYRLWGAYSLWCLTDNSGYIYKFLIYRGKNDESNQQMRKGFDLDEVDLSLTKPLSGNNYKFYFDNHFSSIPILEKLQQLSFYSFRTIRPSYHCVQRKRHRGSALNFQLSWH